MTIKTRLGAQRYNNRMARIFATARALEAERLARGEKPNPNLTGADMHEPTHKVYSIDVRIYGTAYIKAADASEALAKVKALNSTAMEVDGALISGRQYNDPDLPDISLSPAMTIVGPEADDTPAEAG